MSESMSLHALVGTAGHVDHGKTRLLEALTGIDCDRWAEEKARGITIDLGFAHLELDGMELGFVDVPGHERFLHNALAGLGGIRVLLLVVAADEGVRPQTREHLAIATLLGIPRAVVALTKSDLVSEEFADLAALEVAELLAGGPFAAAPVLPVSSLTGAGLDALRAALLEAARAEATAARGLLGPVRLPVDRAFHLKGQGVVVTGTLVSGRISAGAALALHPGGESVRVRGVQVHGRARDAAEAGERTALQLAGVELAALTRGTTLHDAGAFCSSRRLLARFRLLPEAPGPVRRGVRVKVHHFAQEAVGWLRPLAPAELVPGETGLVELRLREPLLAARGDRFVVRRLSPVATLGGGELLDPAWQVRRAASRPPVLAALAADDAAAVLQWVADAGLGAVSTVELARRLGRAESSVAPLVAELSRAGRLLELASAGTASHWVAPAAVERLAQSARSELKAFFARERLAAGMPRAEAIRRLLPGRAADHADVYLGWLASQRVLVSSGELVTLPGRQAELTGEESKLSQAAVELLEAAGLAAPSPGEVAARLGAKPQILEGVLRFLVSRGRVTRLPGGLLVASAAVATLRDQLVATGWERFTVGQFKDHFGLSRKWAIPLLEHLDSLGATRRVGEERMILRRTAPPPGPGVP